MAWSISRLIDQKVVYLYECCYCKSINLIVHLDDFDVIRCWKCNEISVAGDGFKEPGIGDGDLEGVLIENGQEVKNDYGI